MTVIKRRWPGPRINFNFLDCSQCKRRIRAAYCHELSEQLVELEAAETDIKKKAIERAKHEGIDKHERLKNPADRFYGKLEEYAQQKLSYYECYKCKKPYFGGMKDCDAANEEAKEGGFDPKELVCGKCAS